MGWPSFREDLEKTCDILTDDQEQYLARLGTSPTRITAADRALHDAIRRSAEQLQTKLRQASSLVGTQEFSLASQVLAARETESGLRKALDKSHAEVGRLKAALESHRSQAEVRIRDLEASHKIALQAQASAMRADLETRMADRLSNLEKQRKQQEKELTHLRKELSRYKR